MARAETYQTQGRGDTKEGARNLAAGVAVGAARGFAVELRRQRTDFTPPTEEPISGFKPRRRITRALKREVAFAKDASVLALTRATLVGAAQGAAVAGITEVGRKAAKTPKNPSRA